MSTPTRTIDDFFQKEYRDFAAYTIKHRAIPSMIDGFKPSQRKIAYAAHKLWGQNTTKSMKVFQLGGQAASMAFYHHGSLDQTIIGMTQPFKNSLPIFDGVGQFGSLRSPKAGAPRYVGVKFSANFARLYKDFDLTSPQYEEGAEIEPLYFLPIVPTVLLNGGSGIAVGFSTKILNRNPVELVDACVDVLMTGTTERSLHPWYADFHGEVQPVGDSGKSWAFLGEVEQKNTSTVEIREIPPGYTYEKYEAVLDALCESGQLVSYEDNSSDRINYVLKFRRKDLAQYSTPAKLRRLLKLTEKVTENITTLSPQGNLRVFDSAPELVVEFVSYRLGYYQTRKERTIERLESEIERLSNRARFIAAVISGDLIVSNRKKRDIESDLRVQKFARVKGSFDYLLSMQIYTLTAEKYSELQSKLREAEVALQEVRDTTPKQMYLTDLDVLRKQLVKHVPGDYSYRKVAPKSTASSIDWSESDYTDGEEVFSLL
tara:strand:+ start:12313 stop:13773 length:1461 start_codon:yes stop_codon:yes gene_type:complete